MMRVNNGRADVAVRRMALEERIDNIGKSERKIKRKRKDEEDVSETRHTNG